MVSEFESVSKYLSSSECLSSYHPANAGPRLHTRRESALVAAAVGAINVGKLTRCSLLSRVVGRIVQGAQRKLHGRTAAKTISA